MAPKKPPTPEPTARSSKSALLEAATEAIADHKPLPKPGPAPAPRRIMLRSLMALILVGAGATLVAQPAWLVGPSLPSETPAVQAATATMVLVAALSRVQAFESTTGRLPATLREAGLTDSTIQYRSLPDGAFELSKRAADSVVSIRATDSLKTRIGNAIRTLQGRTR